MFMTPKKGPETGNEDEPVVNESELLERRINRLRATITYYLDNVAPLEDNGGLLPSEKVDVYRGILAEMLAKRAQLNRPNE